MLNLTFCSKQENAKTFTCSGDCRNITIKVSGESGEFQVDETCQKELEGGVLKSSTCSGTRKYLNSGHIYHYTSIVNYKNCKYYILVDGIGSCGDKDTSSKSPILTTNNISLVTTTTAQCGGNILSDQGLTITARGVCWSMEPTPSITDNKTNNGSGNGNYTSLITGLSPNANYYVRAYASNSSGIGYGNTLMFHTKPISGETVTDIDGNLYHTISINSQIWMVENLKATHYRNGEPIPNVTDSVEWGKLTTGAYCDYANNPVNSVTYGKLYNWFAVHDSRNLAPNGWHIPSDAEWTTLTTYLGKDIAGDKLKEEGTTHWLSPNSGTNESGFSAIPGGSRFCDVLFSIRDTIGTFSDLGVIGYWWSSTEFQTYYALSRSISNSLSGVGRVLNYRKEDGFSVRCLKD